MRTKLVLEISEIQLLGQIVLEISTLSFSYNMMIPAMLLYEFRMKNAEIFEQPRRCTRKLEMSTILALQKYLHQEHERNDVYWDVTLIGLRNKVDSILLQNRSGLFPKLLIT